MRERLLLLKAHNKGYLRNGKFVGPFDDSRASAKPHTPAAPKPKKAFYLEHASFGGEPAPGPAANVLDDAETDYFADHGAHHTQSNLFGWAGKLYGLKPSPKSPTYPHAVTHPKPNDQGKKVTINEPSQATPEATWDDGKAIATFLPGGKAPKELNGVPFAPWTDTPKTLDEWDYVAGQKDDLEEGAMHLPPGKEPAAGCIIEEPDGRVWIVHPSNGWAGYKATFPKGHAEDELSLQAAAIKEVWEESGLKVEITGLLQDVERGQTVTRYYTAKRVGGTPTDCGWETQAVSLVPKDQLLDELNRPVDHTVAIAAGAKPNFDSSQEWEQIGAQGGSNEGGTYVDDEGVAWYCKYPKSPAVAKNEVLAARLYEAAGIAVPEVKLVHDGEKLGVASQIIDGLEKNESALRAGAPGVREGFAADAWLANWDSVGLLFDNMLLDPDGNAVRLDTGGSLLFRAQGSPKGDAFGDTVGEVNTLRDGKNAQAAAVFKGVTKAQLAAGVKGIQKVSDKKIRALVAQYGPGDGRQREKLAARIIARKNDLIGRYLTEK